MNQTWTQSNVEALFNQPILDLLMQAQTAHRQHFPANKIQLATLLNIKTGACPENCSYCSQSGHHQTEIEKEKLMSTQEVLEKAKQAKANGATRFCLGAAWRSPPAKDLPKVIDMIKEIKAMGLETCVTLGMLNQQQAQQLKEAGLDFYNHNLDTGRDYYDQVVTTRSYDDRLNTLQAVQEAGIHVCCGGILGLGEDRQHRIQLLLELVQLDTPPASVPLNRLVPVAGTPLEKQTRIDDIEFVRTIAVTRIMLPTSVIRLAAGRETMSETMQTLCFLAGCNSIFYGEKLLTETNMAPRRDQQLLEKLGLTAAEKTEYA